MRIIVVIPAFNESANIDSVIARIPRKIVECNEVLVLVVDDGSVDNTAQVAQAAGADKVLRHPVNLGVGQTFADCIRGAIACNADIIASIDGDGQFDPHEIPSIVEPIINGCADVVIGSRFLTQDNGIPVTKSMTNKLLSLLVSFLCGRRITDAQSGFRAMNRSAADSLELTGYFTYTQEMILDLMAKGFRIVEKPIRVRYFDSRKSRVVKSFPHYATRVSGLIMLAALKVHGKKLVVFLAMLCLSLLVFYGLTNLL